MRVFHSLLDEYLSWKWVIVVVILFGYVWNKRQDILVFASPLALPFNVWDFVIPMVSDAFLIIYLILPLWLFYSCKLLFREWEPTIMIRLGGYSQWVGFTLKKIFPTLLVFCLLLLGISFIGAIGVQVSDSWSALTTTEGHYMNNYTYPLYQQGLSPILALLLQVMLMMCFLVVIHVGLATLCIFSGQHQPLLVVVSTFIFVGSIISFKVFPPDWVWLHVINYTILPMTYGSFPSMLVPLGVFVLFITIMVVIITLRFTRKT
ncbi:hypothetical protein G4V62_15115 [Bacillaceae bacterium SIJ1]|uniref:hypothetical protein n=1 Tax=Litoribacterium kuwaitense TaxID=1398745 RepID=UPI0013EDECED|nr:hypothetical protein [Litoribacterium kuwaitense]NGP46217.1 hypothetical protein [Litoribacterium kuwaitense]